MPSTTPVQSRLSDAEWELVIDLLECERRELPTEIHHTDMRELKDRLRRRMAMVDALLDRLKADRGV